MSRLDGEIERVKTFLRNEASQRGLSEGQVFDNACTQPGAMSVSDFSKLLGMADGSEQLAQHVFQRLALDGVSLERHRFYTWLRRACVTILPRTPVTEGVSHLSKLVTTLHKDTIVDRAGVHAGRYGCAATCFGVVSYHRIVERVSVRYPRAPHHSQGGRSEVVQAAQGEDDAREGVAVVAASGTWCIQCYFIPGLHVKLVRVPCLSSFVRSLAHPS